MNTNYGSPASAHAPVHGGYPNPSVEDELPSKEEA